MIAASIARQRVATAVAPQGLRRRPAAAAAAVSRPAPRLPRRRRGGVAARVAQPLERAGSPPPDEEECPLFIDRDGEFVEVMCCDYGFRTGGQSFSRHSGPTIPPSLIKLAFNTFAQEYTNVRRSFRYGEGGSEYAAIAAANPPRGPVGRALYAAGGAVVALFARIDIFLEERKIFSPLLPAGIPKESFDLRVGGLSKQCREVRARLKQLKLDNGAVWAREHAREAAGLGVETPWLVKGVYLALCVFLDKAYDNRPIQRFWFLETVARMPYFVYISCLHLAESMGWWRAGADLRIVHAAEEWNELHHLQVMESLGGDVLWWDRFLGTHAAFIYYWVLVGLFVASPSLAYNFSELIEAHAVDTYGEFVDANEELLKSLPPPLVAAEYYCGQDLYRMFDAFQTSDTPRRPKVKNMYDVFANIRDDEKEHVKTMQACQDFTVAGDLAAKEERALDEALRAQMRTTAPRQPPGGGGGGGEGGDGDGEGEGGDVRTR
ncbi:plastid terminal oxidase [Raphidocelis subcapitata]|uniref:Ubiquinol oxidase n=1 Tax=Raphidocelis subcapitata TaxID=307507 RepID=A0A2V0PLK0_9CHLO|nr:plastid terminal oxidase [Raphidocelis subcapitata]|eukprot:GBF99932.1 plastid terminal oxidase [Raphidocelis subcapitata]